MSFQRRWVDENREWSFSFTGKGLIELCTNQFQVHFVSEVKFIGLWTNRALMIISFNYKINKRWYTVHWLHLYARANQPSLLQYIMQYNIWHGLVSRPPQFLNIKRGILCSAPQQTHQNLIVMNLNSRHLQCKSVASIHQITIKIHSLVFWYLHK